ncbi:proteinase-activated receptor 1-like [Sinocyclocheilus grahami]|uniref:proteinase-activated receptor 1-like n=1 Tax=Sinocyclocheilus grahami TaxID=75366 RepID=UPI0007AD58AC|nr:PREDICTED: proteinase-activated receptor 1-like [Sinocyclocheilus grahami]
MRLKFRMLTLKQVVSQIKSEDWKFLRFAFRGEAYQYQVLPFGLALSPQTFTKCKGLPAIKQTLSRWIVDAISISYESSGLPSPLGVKAHSTRSLVASKAFLSGVAMQDVCNAADSIIARIFKVIEEIITFRQPRNRTDLDAVNCNKTSQDAYNITADAVLFLRGLLVTRLMPSFYIIIILISFPLNALALVTFTCKIREKKPAVIYMSHLACVDVLFTLLLPLKIHYHLNASDWVFGEAACRVLSAAYYCYMYCSILLMMSMSVDRLLAVVFPIASLTWRSTRKATCVCVLVWLLALAGTVPLLSITQTFKIKDVGVTCHDVLYHTQVYAYLFSILSCLYFFLPLIITIVSYSTIIYVLTTKNDHLATSYPDKRRRAVIMAIGVLSEFVMCFAPTNGILLYHCVRLATGIVA